MRVQISISCPIHDSKPLKSLVTSRDVSLIIFLE